MTFFDSTQPLGIPKGSVRAILALGLTAAYVTILGEDRRGVLERMDQWPGQHRRADVV
ncbi:MAG: hypothetical protein R6U98_17800 [Pirellulaceae bacterium]